MNKKYKTIIARISTLKKIGLVFWLVLGVAIVVGISGTRAYFSDQATITGITFSMADDFGQSGDVIINEVMWMGSKGDVKDQWVELKNISDHDVHLKGWYLNYKNDAGEEKKLFEIKDNRVIKKGQYFLATHFKKNNSAIDVNPDTDDLSNFDYADFQLKLYDGEKTLIDVAGDGEGEPQKGSAEHFYSMQRKDAPGDGADYANWYSCQDSDSWKYWDNQAQFGTPGEDNSDGETESLKQKKLKADDVVPAENGDLIPEKVGAPEKDTPALVTPSVEDVIVEVEAETKQPEAFPIPDE